MLFSTPSQKPTCHKQTLPTSHPTHSGRKTAPNSVHHDLHGIWDQCSLPYYSGHTHSTGSHTPHKNKHIVPHYKCNKPTKTRVIIATQSSSSTCYIPAIGASENTVPVIKKTQCNNANTVIVITTGHNNNIPVQHIVTLRNLSSATQCRQS